jgi:hypothetical protein
MVDVAGREASMRVITSHSSRISTLKGPVAGTSGPVAGTSGPVAGTTVAGTIEYLIMPACLIAKYLIMPACLIAKSH